MVEIPRDPRLAAEWRETGKHVRYLLAREFETDRWTDVRFEVNTPQWVSAWIAYVEEPSDDWVLPNEVTCRAILMSGCIGYYPPSEQPRSNLFYPPTTFGLCPNCSLLTGLTGPNARGLYQCTSQKCRHQTSIEALSALKGTRLPLDVCFAAGVLCFAAKRCGHLFTSSDISKLFNTKFDSAQRLRNRLTCIFDERGGEMVSIDSRLNRKAAVRDIVMPLIVSLPVSVRPRVLEMIGRKGLSISHEDVLDLANEYGLSAETLRQKKVQWKSNYISI